MALLSALSQHTPRLQVLALEVYPASVENWTPERWAAVAIWDKLDTLPSKLPELCTVAIDTSRLKQKTKQQVVGLMESRLPNLRRRGMLRFVDERYDLCMPQFPSTDKFATTCSASVIWGSYAAAFAQFEKLSGRAVDGEGDEPTPTAHVARRTPHSRTLLKATLEQSRLGWTRHINLHP